MAKKSGLDASARDKLLARVQTMRGSDKGKLAANAALKAKRAVFTKFETLPGYEEIRMQRLFGERFGLANPYFKMHDGLASSRTSIEGKEYLNFSCYDYLSLNGHPEIVDAAKGAIDRFGISCSGSRVVAGERIVHRQLEEGLAKHYGAEDALLFVSGYGTNVCVIGQMLGAKDLVLFDSAAHNSIVTGAVMSGATRRTFPHNDMDALAAQLEQLRDRYERVMIVVEGHYSMDGDYPDMPRLLEIKEKYGCWLMVDEAHSLGVLGATGHGVTEVFGFDPTRVDIWMGTLSKTLVGAGGYVAGSAVMIDFLRSLGGAFVYSVALPSVIAATAAKALELMHREPERVQKLQANARHFAEVANAKGLNLGTSMQTAISPVIVGDSLPAAMLSDRMFKRGINVQPVLYPGVPPKTSRLRFFLNTAHTFEDIEHALDVVVEELAQIENDIKNIPLNMKI